MPQEKFGVEPTRGSRSSPLPRGALAGARDLSPRSPISCPFSPLARRNRQRRRGLRRLRPSSPDFYASSLTPDPPTALADRESPVLRGNPPLSAKRRDGRTRTPPPGNLPVSLAGRRRQGLVPDAHLAALAFESGCEWITIDRDYSRFHGLRWRHPSTDPVDPM
jgi:hypothetical protein